MHLLPCAPVRPHHHLLSLAILPSLQSPKITTPLAYSVLLLQPTLVPQPHSLTKLPNQLTNPNPYPSLLTPTSKALSPRPEPAIPPPERRHIIPQACGPDHSTTQTRALQCPRYLTCVLPTATCLSSRPTPLPRPTRTTVTRVDGCTTYLSVGMPCVGCASCRLVASQALTVSVSSFGSVTGLVSGTVASSGFVTSSVSGSVTATYGLGGGGCERC